MQVFMIFYAGLICGCRGNMEGRSCLSFRLLNILRKVVEFYVP